MLQSKLSRLKQINESIQTAESLAQNKQVEKKLSLLNMGLILGAVILIILVIALGFMGKSKYSEIQTLNNVITGANGNNYLSGGAGNDQLAGNAGNDTLSGDLGNDSLYGGAGVDLYSFSGNFGHDWICIDGANPNSQDKVQFAGL